MSEESHAFWVAQMNGDDDQALRDDPDLREVYSKLEASAAAEYASTLRGIVREEAYEQGWEDGLKAGRLLKERDKPNAMINRLEVDINTWRTFALQQLKLRRSAER